MAQRIYLDNAATSWPKPELVYDAADLFLRKLGAASGRGGYQNALEANRIVERTRRGIARLIGAGNSNQVAFTCSGTDSLNLAIQGILRPGDHVVTTHCEHNSVLRPLQAMQEMARVEISFVPCDEQGTVSPNAVREALRPETRLVAVIHASNVTGALQPVGEIGQILSKHQALLLVDAAQSLGHVPIDVHDFEIDLLAAPGHKGLLGPLGTGLLYIREGVEQHLRPLRLGGTGTQSNEDSQPDTLPEKYEAGNHNLPGLAGLAAAVEWLEARTIEQIHSRHMQMTEQLIDGLAAIDGIRIVGPRSTAQRTSVVSFAADGYDPQEFAVCLDVSAGVECRAGLHCAPRMHAALGSDRTGGLVRLSPGWSTTDEEIELALSAIATLAESLIKYPHG
ncbi:MAG: aminotransferase class V-fold PLP-dependent enzyme [Planctomycetales bacterium]|nr:aminotransferase class V-fold PLP-dependent enzyme [Planctomycetales bacterium]